MKNRKALLLAGLVIIILAVALPIWLSDSDDESVPINAAPNLTPPANGVPGIIP